MAKSLRSKSERAKRRAKREKLLPREIERLRKLAQIAQDREEAEKREQENQVVAVEYRRRTRKQRVRHDHVRSMRSGPKPYQTLELLEKEYVPKPRDYEKMLDETALDSDDNDVFSDSDDDFQELSRARDGASAAKKEAIADIDGKMETMLRAYKKKHKRYPKWLNSNMKKRIYAYRRKGCVESDLIFDYS